MDTYGSAGVNVKGVFITNYMRNFFIQHHLCPWQERMPVSAQNYTSPRTDSYTMSTNIPIMAGSPPVFHGGTEDTNT